MTKRANHAKADRSIEVRRLARKVELRAEAGEDPRIGGYAAVFNSLSLDLGGFREIIRPGAFDKTLREGRDIQAIWNHPSSDLLGRTSSGTLRVAVDETGLAYEVDVPNTQVGRDAVELIRRGDVSGSSFAFRTVKDRFTSDEKGAIREILEAQVFDVSPVIDPAYPEGSVSLRSLPGLADLEDEIALRALLSGQGLTADEISARLLANHQAGGPASKGLSHRKRAVDLALAEIA